MVTVTPPTLVESGTLSESAIDPARFEPKIDTKDPGAIAGTVIVNMGVKIGITLVYAGRKGVPAVIAMTASVVALVISIGIAATRL